MNILLINALLYVSWFTISFYRQRKVTIYSLLVLFYAVVACLGYLTVENGIYYDVFGYQSVDALTIEPYLYTFISYYILFWPLKHIRIDSRSFDVIFSQKISFFVKAWVVYFSLFAMLKLVEALASISLGLGEAYEARHVDGQNLFNYNNIILEKFNGYGFFLLNATVPFIMAYVFISLYKNKIKYTYAMFLIFLCYIPSILSGIAMGSRGGLFMTAFSFLFFIPLFWQFIPKVFMSKIYYYMTAFVALIVFYSWAITSDRVGKGNDGLNSILRYFGESFPNLGFNFWNKVSFHPMGSRLFPNFFLPNEDKLYTSVDDSYQYWAYKTGVPVLNFKTYFGDLYIEFGLIYAIMFVILTSILVWKYFKVFKLNVFNLPFLYYYYQLCIFAFAGFTKGGHLAFFQLIIVLIISILLKYLSKTKKIRKIQNTHWGYDV